MKAAKENLAVKITLLDSIYHLSNKLLSFISNSQYWEYLLVSKVYQTPWFSVRDYIVARKFINSNRPTTRPCGFTEKIMNDEVVSDSV